MQSKYTQIMVLNLEKWRVQHGYNQTEFGKMIGMSKSTYSRLISGEKNEISVDTLKHIYDVTGQLCHMLMEIYTDDYLKMSKICRTMTPAELSFMLYTAQNLILMREGKMGRDTE